MLSFGAPAQADFPSRKSCAPWHALSARPGPGTCLPRCCPSLRPISAATRGPRHASPVLPPRGTAGFRTKGWGRGRGAAVCLLSPRGLRPSNSRFLKEPRPVRRALSGSRLAVRTAFLFYLSLAPVQRLSWCPEGGFGKPLGQVSLRVLHTGKFRLTEAGGLLQIARQEMEQGARCSDYQLGKVSPDFRCHLLSCTVGQVRKHTQGNVSLTFFILGGGTRRLQRQMSLSLRDFPLG